MIPRGLRLIATDNVRSDNPPRTAAEGGLDADGNLVEKDNFRLQTRHAFENLGTALRSVGAGFDDVVKMTMYVADMSELEVLREVRSEFMAPPPPATTLVQVERFAHQDFLLEIVTDRGRQEVHLELDRQHLVVGGHESEGCIAAGAVGDACHGTGMYVCSL